MDELDDIVYEYERSNMTTDELIFKLSSYLLSRIESIDERLEEVLPCKKKK